MEQFRCKPIHGFRDIVVEVPGSKSMTNRALLLGALADGVTVLDGVLFSDDSRVFMEALRDIGFRVDVEEERRRVTVQGLGGRFPEGGKREIYVGSAGTAARFLTAFLGLSGQSFVLDSSEQMKSRPMEPLLRALEQMGVVFEYLEKPYRFPFRIVGYRPSGVERVDLNIDESSQFLSALLLCGTVCGGLTVHLTGQRDARAYVKISMKMMEDFGVRIRQTDRDTYWVPGQTYRAGVYQIEPDVSAACYFYAMAAVSGCRGLVRHVHRDSTQGDIRFLHVLEQMGCRVEEETEGLAVTGPAPGSLRGVSVDMSDFSDQTMTLAAIAPFADRETVITGVRHIRGQESDRIRGIVTELGRMQIRCREREDGVVIFPGKCQPATIETYGDHRMAMAFAVTGCAADGIVIDDPGCCRKTFENYFEVLTNLGLSLQ